MSSSHRSADSARSRSPQRPIANDADSSGIFTLRALLREGHVRAFNEGGVADDVVEDKEYASKLQVIQQQRIATKALLNRLTLLGQPTAGAPSLHQLIEPALQAKLITRKEAGVLRAINREANAAKHEL